MSNDIDLQLGRRLRRRRRDVGLTQEALGLACGISFQQVQKYECAANRMSAVVLWRLARVLDVDVGYFYEGLRPEPGPCVRLGRPRPTDAMSPAP